VQIGEPLRAGRAAPQQQFSLVQAPHARHLALLDPLWFQARQRRRGAGPARRAETGDRAFVAPRILPDADGGAEFHHCLVVRSRIGG
jgi:hypothetical protein